MPEADPVLARLRAIRLALPDTEETLTWGTPHFRVGEQIFCGYGAEKGGGSLGFKLEAAHAKRIVADPRFWPAPYVGHKGWVSMAASGIDDWEEVRELVHESYRLIAPKRSLARLAGEGPNGAKQPSKPQPARAAPSRTTSKATRVPTARGKGPSKKRARRKSPAS